MSDLLSELEAVVGLAEKATPGEWDVFVRRGGMIDVASSHNCTVACTAVPVVGDREANAKLIVRLVNLFRTHHAEIAAAVRDAERWRALKFAEAPMVTVTGAQLAKGIKPGDYAVPWDWPITAKTKIRLIAMSAREGQ